MMLMWGDRELQFEPVELYFEPVVSENVFSRMNEKTVLQIVAEKKYKKLAGEVNARYSEYGDRPVGEFLFHLKERGDGFYRRFLNRYGDEKYARFWITDQSYLSVRGLYAYTSSGELRYIGRCLDSFRKRINNGYGRIDPRNCYLDGQSTNCRLNSLIRQACESVQLWICRMENQDDIIEAEEHLREEYRNQLLWNDPAP